jgi:hypothetical protein
LHHLHRSSSSSRGSSSSSSSRSRSSSSSSTNERSGRESHQGVIYDLSNADPHTERQVQLPRAAPRFLAEQRAQALPCRRAAGRGPRGAGVEPLQWSPTSRCGGRTPYAVVRPPLADILLGYRLSRRPVEGQAGKQGH